MCDLRHADIGIGQQRLGGFDVVIGEFWRAASGAAKPTGGGEARLGAFPDQTAVEFRKCAKHVKNQPTLRGRRVERFGQTAKPDALTRRFSMVRSTASSTAPDDRASTRSGCRRCARIQGRHAKPAYP